MCGKPGQREAISQLISAEHLYCFGKDTLYSLQLLRRALPELWVCTLLADKSKLLRLPPVRGQPPLPSAPPAVSPQQEFPHHIALHTAILHLAASGNTQLCSEQGARQREASLPSGFIPQRNTSLNYIYLFAIRACRKKKNEAITKRLLPSLWLGARNTLAPHRSSASFKASSSLTSSVLLKAEICWF